MWLPWAGAMRPTCSREAGAGRLWEPAPSGEADAPGGLPCAALRLPGRPSPRKCLPQGKIPESEIPHCVRDDKERQGD